MKSRYSVVILFVCLIIQTNPFAQSFVSGTSFIDLVPINDDTLEANGWTEDVNLRNLNSSTWHHADGRIRVEYSKRPVNYRGKNQHWERITKTLEKSATGWEASKQPHEIAISNQGMVTLDAGETGAVSYGAITIINGEIANALAELKSYNFLVCPDIVPGIDKEILVFENSFKTQYRLNHPIENNSDSFSIGEELNLPDGAEIIADERHGKWENGKWFGRLLIKDKFGVTINTINEAWCYDQTHEISAASYTWESLAGRLFLYTHTDWNWLNYQDRHYPVVIDPLVVGPLAEFGMNFMPSCYIPEYHADSLLITVPGQITVTGFFVTTSFTCDPPAVKGDGAMYFSTTCAQSGTFTVQPPEDAIPGIAYLENFDFRNPLMCCFEPSCSETSFYLRMHLGRFTPEGDCDDYNLVYYNPGSPWPFKAFIEGHTVETYGSEWTVSSLPICSNECITEGRIRMKFGVPPYTITHPWMTGSMVVETPTPCDLSNKYSDLPLNVPGCPLYCPDYFSMDVPPPVVTDACGNTIPDLPFDLLNIKPAPDVIQPDVYICNNTGYDIVPLSCEEESVIHWAGNGQEGSGPIVVQLDNPGGGVFDYTYLCSAEANGCFSDTVNFIIHILPDPAVGFTIIPEPAMVNLPVYFNDQSSAAGSEIVNWLWEVNGANQQSGYQTDYTLNTPGIQEVCLQVTTDEGCVGTLCKQFEVTLNNIVAPNIFTPNGDGSNDFLVFRYLEFFPENHLTVYNRWGNIVFETDNYDNNWNGGDVSDGTYYYVLNMTYAEGISGYVHVIRN